MCLQCSKCSGCPASVTLLLGELRGVKAKCETRETEQSCEEARHMVKGCG